MRRVTLDRDAFVAAVQKNRDGHRAVFKAALEGYRQRWTEELERRLRRVRRGEPIVQLIAMPEPEDHTADYDRVLTMARMSIEDTIELTEDEFAMYVMDQWDWKARFVSTSTRYTARRVAGRG